jgi:hypothetical protein
MLMIRPWRPISTASARNGLRPRQDAEFDFQIARFGQLHGMKAPVFESRGARGVGNGAIDGAYGKNVADASPQLAAQV